MPSFLLGGINVTYNIFGSRTARTAAYGAFEVGAKLTPVILFFGMAAHRQVKSSQFVSVEPEVVEVRRASLTQ